MAIIQQKKDNGDVVYKYRQPGDGVLYERVALVLDSLETYVDKLSDLKLEDIIVDAPLLAEALVRIDKRKDYFVIYHDETDMNEVKEAALLAYWLLKFKPLTVKLDDEFLHRKYIRINETFAVFVLYSALKEEAKRNGMKSFGVSKEYNKKIMYAFKYWDISKEALMLIAESLSEAILSKKE